MIRSSLFINILLALTLVSCAAPPGDLTSGSASTPASSSSVAMRALLPDPLPDGPRRVTKKPFGIHVAPGDSPVSPERFTGYHAGTDFETFPEEQKSDVPVAVVCDGTALFTGRVKGYGGVLVQSCTVNGEPVTILYGHLRSSSISAQKGDALRTGRSVAVLGNGFSPETDGERKHLHLAVHRGTAIDFRGYVGKESELGEWVDAY